LLGPVRDKTSPPEHRCRNITAETSPPEHRDILGQNIAGQNIAGRNIATVNNL
jgi:hypothetical protein